MTYSVQPLTAPVSDKTEPDGNDVVSKVRGLGERDTQSKLRKYSGLAPADCPKIGHGWKFNAATGVGVRLSHGANLGDSEVPITTIEISRPRSKWSLR